MCSSYCSKGHVLVMELSTIHISIVLSVGCMGVVFVGGWYLQSSLMEEQYHNMEQVKQLSKKISDQNSIIEHLLKEVGKVRTAHVLIYFYTSTDIEIRNTSV